MGVENIKKEMQVFQSSVKKLSTGVGAASSLWKDNKFSELSNSVGQIANHSKDVLISGDRCCNSIAKFEKIASEKY